MVLLVSVGWWTLSAMGLVGDLSAALFESDWKTDFDKRVVEMDEITSGGPPKDGIPAVDRPKFIKSATAAEWLDAREPVIVFAHAGVARAYPLQILMFHEIVNDEVAGIPISVTFCPLCNASLVYDRRLDGRLLDFGTTGMLRKSDLVMYDRQTETWWQQFTGEAIVGELVGKTLTRLDATIVAFADFRTAYPNGEVLSRDTGHSRPYGKNPYAGYDEVGNFPFLLGEQPDGRLPPMERVLSVQAGNNYRLYPFKIFQQQPIINDTFGQLPVVVFTKGGTLSVLDARDISASRTVHSATAFKREVRGRELNFEQRDGAIVDRETGSTWDLFGRAISGELSGAKMEPVDGGVHFAFAWLAFRPDSEIYQP
jgi:hypothetical protein